MSQQIYLAIDLGAESGRVMAVWIDRGRVGLQEIHRFRHQPFLFPSGLHWNMTGIWEGILDGLRAAASWARHHGHSIRSLGVDAWGVDWALLDASGEVIGLPHAYRDPRNMASYHRVLQKISAEEIYKITGIQLMPINTLFSLAAFAEASPDLLQAAQRLVFIPDLIHYWLSGATAVERTIASTSQLVDIHKSTWSESLIDCLGLPRRLFPELTPAGTELGALRSAVVEATALDPAVRVIAPAAHDTASAVVSVPATGKEPWAYLSSGTWSLLGAELSCSCTSDRAREWNFTNEAGYGGTVRLLKNIAGLWIVQECRRAWSLEGRQWEYAELMAEAEKVPAWRTLIDPDAPQFQQPGHMPEKIAAFARETRQPIPTEPGELVRCALESLALAYRRTLIKLESIVGSRCERLHIVGGGSQNRLLNQLTADLCQRPVLAGPVEATAIGNGLVQAIAQGELSGLAELRQVVAASHIHAPLFEPRPDLDVEEVESLWLRLLR